jgi:hypothetical protein
MTFKSERHLVDDFVNLLETNQTPWGKLECSREFDYARGRTDVVAVSDTDVLIAIEAKLKDWKYALHQAYRNTCFAHQSFVLLPKKIALSAALYGAEFERRGVGLCYMENSLLVVIYNSRLTTPIEPWLACEAISQVRKINSDKCPPHPSRWSQ